MLRALMERHPTRKVQAAGFSLMEMLFAIVILAILVSIAVPTFNNAIRKSRRADGIQALRALQLSQERHRSNNTTYGTTTQILGSNTTSPGGWYTLAITSPTATGYTATATAVSGTSQTADSASGVSCATLTVDADGIVPGSPSQAPCWAQ